MTVPDAERVELLAALDGLMRTGHFILGDEVVAFESLFAEHCERDHCVGVSDGTGALYLALRAHGVGSGDEVVTTAMSWVATANAISALGATPVFADVTDDYNLDPRAAEQAVTSRTKAIVPVHFYGRVAPMSDFMDIGRRHGIPVIEDASQAFGASLNGRPAGSFGDSAAFSLNPMKPLAALGEAGATVTNSAEIADHIRALRYLGTVNRETCIDPSLNFKIDTLQAVILNHRMKRIAENIAWRNRVASLYTEALDGVVGVPQAPLDGVCAYFDYTIQSDDRDRLETWLLNQGIEVKVKHRLLMGDQPGYAGLPVRDTPNARRLVQGILCLPIHEAMTENDVSAVVDAIRAYHGR